jgi:K+-sensing histidine kinase KdpD
MEKDKNYLKFLTLRNIAKSIIILAPLKELVQDVLDKTIEIMGLESCSITIWENGNTLLEVVSGQIEKNDILQKFDKEVILSMRRGFSVESVYLTLKQDKPESLFSYPIKFNNEVIGAISGLCEGHRNLTLEEEFLEALSCQLRIAIFEIKGWKSKQEFEKEKELIEKTKLSTISDTVVAVNHEINNPLTAILGNAQLLLSKGEEINAETKEKLRVIENSALRIKEITQKLTKITKPVSKEYAGGVKMLDIEKSSQEEKPPE